MSKGGPRQKRQKELFDTNVNLKKTTYSSVIEAEITLTTMELYDAIETIVEDHESDKFPDVQCLIQQWKAH